MRKIVITAFDDFVVGTTVVYTPQALNATLGNFDKLAIECVADQVGGTIPTITAAVEHSNDQRNWKQKNASPDISGSGGLGLPLLTTTTNNFIGSDTGAAPSLGFVRLNITLGGTSPIAHVKLLISARDTGKA